MFNNRSRRAFYSFLGKATDFPRDRIGGPEDDGLSDSTEPSLAER